MEGHLEYFFYLQGLNLSRGAEDEGDHEDLRMLS